MTQVKNGKALQPYNPLRPESLGVTRALENDDVEMLKLALTPRQRRFCEEYVVDFKAAEAYIRSGYSKNNASAGASNLLKNKGVAYYITHLSQSKESKIISIDPDYVIAQVTAIISRDGTKDSDKLRACELLARHLGMFVDRTEITGRDGEAIQIHNQKIEEQAQSFTNLMNQLKRRADEEKSVH